MIPFHQNRLTEDAQAVLKKAHQEAEKRHAPYVDVEHVLLGLLTHPGGTADELLARAGADKNAVYAQVAAQIGMERGEPIQAKDLTEATKETLIRAVNLARELKHEAVDSGHILAGLLGEPSEIVQTALAGLDAGAIREFLQNTSPVAVNQPLPKVGRSWSRRRTPASEQKGFVLVPVRPRKASNRPQTINRPRNWPWVLAAFVALVAYLIFVLPGSSLFTFAFVFAGWIFSLTLHEFSHALVAYWGGDYTVKDKGYLSFNPLKYTHPLLSIVMPLIFLAMGGIGLPGGAVYIERHRLRSKWWGAAVSAAGPAANLLFALLLAAPFFLGLVDVDLMAFRIIYKDDINDILYENPGMTEDQVLRDQGYENPGGLWGNTELWSAVAFLAMLQITAVILNLLPIPPLDGFGIIEPFLDENAGQALRQFGFAGGIFLVFFLLWTVDPVARAFWDTVYDACRTLNIPGWLSDIGYTAFMFWRDPPL